MNGKPATYWIGLTVVVVASAVGLSNGGTARADEPSVSAWRGSTVFVALQRRYESAATYYRCATLAEEGLDAWMAPVEDVPRRHAHEGTRLTLALRRVSAWASNPSECSNIPLDLDSVCRAWLGRHGRLPGSRVVWPAEGFLLSACCHARGKEELGDSILRALCEFGDGALSLSEVEEDVEQLMFWNVQLEFGDEGLGLPSVLLDVEWFLSTFDDGPYTALAREYAADLRERAGRSGLGPPNAPCLEFLAHRLAHQGYAQLCEHHLAWPEAAGQAHTPAMLLYRFGWASVPALLSALEDRRFTRFLVWSAESELLYSHSVLRVRDVALRVLAAIEVRDRLGIPLPTSEVEPLADRRAREVARRIERWLQER